MSNQIDIERVDSNFVSEGTRCAGWLFRPGGIENPPIVILAHGFAGERAFGLVRFAERFASNDFAAFVFDYRSFGDSEGIPRNNVDPVHHGQDWDAAIAHVRTLEGLDLDRIALWGTSFSGAHVICAASRDDKIAATISQVPYSGIPEEKVVSEIKVSSSMVFRAIWDYVKTAITGSPHYIAVVGPPGSSAILNTAESEAGYFALIPEGSTFDNRVPAKALIKFGKYDPIPSAELVTCPALVIAGEGDSLIPVAQARFMASKLQKGEFETLACKHFEPYLGEWFEKNIALQLDFLNRVLA